MPANLESRSGRLISCALNEIEVYSPTQMVFGRSSEYVTFRRFGTMLMIADQLCSTTSRNFGIRETSGRDAKPITHFSSATITVYGWIAATGRLPGWRQECLVKNGGITRAVLESIQNRSELLVLINGVESHSLRRCFLVTKQMLLSRFYHHTASREPISVCDNFRSSGNPLKINGGSVCESNAPTTG